MLRFVADIGLFLFYPVCVGGVACVGASANEHIFDKLSNHIYSAGQAFGKALPDLDLQYSPFSLQSTWLGFWLYLYSLDADHEVEVHFSGN